MNSQNILLFLLGIVVSATPFYNSTGTQDPHVVMPTAYCSDLVFSPNGSFQETFCTIKAENIANFKFALPEIQTNNNFTYNNSILSRRHFGRPPPPPANARLLWSEPSDRYHDNSNTFNQCINDGPKPNTKHVKKLCSRVDKCYVIRRAVRDTGDPSAGPCVCKVWSYKTAVFSVCNCDSCDALIIKQGLKDKCREISQHCTTKGYSSGYIKMPDAGAMYEQHMLGKGEKEGVKIEMGDLNEVMKSTCRSGDSTRDGQDETGVYIQCVIITNPVEKKCWRTTDPDTFWYEPTHFSLDR